LYKEETLSYIGRVCNGLEELLMVFNGIPADGQYATTCWSKLINNSSISIKCTLVKCTVWSNWSKWQ